MDASKISVEKWDVSEIILETSEISVEKLPPADFSKWVYEIDDTARKVNIYREEQDWIQHQSIYQISSFPRRNNPNEFTPQMISLGPYHHGEEHLKVNEQHKRRALAHFLHRADMQLKPFVRKLIRILKRLEYSYQGLHKKWIENPFEFLKMMLLDGCFMIEVLRLHESSDDYAPNDPVFGSHVFHLRKPFIKRDMLLLENQLPLLVLKALLVVENLGPTGDKYINHLVINYCGDYLKANLPRLARHPLELYRMSMFQGDTRLPLKEYNLKSLLDDERGGQFETPTISGTKLIENAVKLREIGVRFRSQPVRKRNINFDPKTGWLELPVIPVHDGTEHLFLNMIVYEKIYVGHEIMSYILFMDELINTEDDVELLQKRGIITNSLGSPKAIADLFHSVAKEATHNPYDALNNIRFELSEYYEETMRRQANIWHQYLHNPWKVLSVVALSLVLTLVQTLYSALSFHLRK